MDLANFSKSLSSMLTQEIYRDCNSACTQNDSQSDAECAKNCSSKGATLIQKFEQAVKTEIPRLQEVSRIQ
jgi:hypothetical protein